MPIPLDRPLIPFVALCTLAIRGMPDNALYAPSEVRSTVRPFDAD
jgi:hypothetical protein